MDDIIDMLDDKVDNLIGQDTDVVRNAYKAIKKPLLDFTKSVLRDDELRMKKLPKRTTIGEIREVIIKSEENVDFIEDVIEQKKARKGEKIYSLDDLFRLAEERIPLLDTVSKKNPTYQVFGEKFVWNIGNGFFMRKLSPLGRPDISKATYLGDKITGVEPSKDEFNMLFTFTSPLYKGERKVKYNYVNHTVSRALD